MSADEFTTEDLATAMPGNTAALAVRVLGASAESMTPEEREDFERALQRIVHFPRELGWLMVYVGVLGIVLPGVIGFPLVIAGGAVLVPGGRKWLSRRWAGRNPGRLVRASLAQIIRLADDLERRYPNLPGAVS